MAWSTPKTWTAGSVLTAADMNTYVRDNDSALYTMRVFNVNYIVGDGVNEVNTGVAGYITIPFGCTITDITLLADQAGAIEIDLWKNTYSNYPPTSADTITASARPKLHQSNLDAASAVDKGGGLVGIPITGHSFVAGDEVIISGTTNYDGTYIIQSISANEIVITATYTAETFTGSETASMRKNQDTTLSGWTTSVTADDIIAVNIVSVTSITRITLAIGMERAL